MAGANDEMETEKAVGRGRPRSVKAHRAILDAAGTLMLEGGIGAASMEAIAARAGVSKATIYKWWPSRGAVALEGFLEQVKQTIEIPDGLSAREGVTFALTKLTELLLDRNLAPMMMGVISQAQSDPEISNALRDQWLAPRRAVSRKLLLQGVSNGEIRADADVDIILDSLFAPLYHRVIFSLEPFTPETTAQLVDQVFEGIKAR